MLEENNLTGDILSENVDKLLNDSKYRNDMIKNLEKFDVNNSTDKIYKAIKEII